MAHIWSFPTRIIFGAGETAVVGTEAKALGLDSVLIVADPGVEAAGLLAPVRAALAEAGVGHATFTGVEGNPTEANIRAGALAYQDAKAQGLVAVGGGSPIDSAKLIAVRVTTSRPFEELDDAIDGGQFIPKDVPAVLALPTTAGTGSEVGRSGVVTLESTGRKTVIFAPQLLPRVAILDPELSVGLPAKITAATGFDALTHCVEAYLSKGVHPMADAIAVAGIDLVQKYLRRAVAQGDDLEARGGMLQAAMMGAVAFQKGLGACHSLAHPLSSECGLHHGLANAICLPAVATFNEQTSLDRLLHVALLLGGEPEPGAATRALLSLRQEIGLSPTLSSVGVKREQLPRLAELAFMDACHHSNPRECTQADMLSLYEAAMG
ncbi:MAG: iron-containing alcohol dehydrogenase [Myxococcales bacterium]|nr:iron-containing alcohol dehydrogenase [Myxococcales bacterium]